MDAVAFCFEKFRVVSSIVFSSQPKPTKKGSLSVAIKNQDLPRIILYAEEEQNYVQLDFIP